MPIDLYADSLPNGLAEARSAGVSRLTILDGLKLELKSYSRLLELLRLSKSSIILKWGIFRRIECLLLW